ncbi:MAG: AIR synthase-related protein [Nitrososphaeria archaeon]
MAHRIEVFAVCDELDIRGKNVKNKIEELFNVKLDSVRTRQAYTIDAELSSDEIKKLKNELFADTVVENASSDTNFKWKGFDWVVVVGYKPGVTDNVGRTAKRAAEELLGRRFKDQEGVYTSIQYFIRGGNLRRRDVEKISRFCLGTNPSTGANPIINSVNILSRNDYIVKGIPIVIPVVRGQQKADVREYDLWVDEEKLMEISRQRILSLSLEEMKAIKEYFSRPDVVEQRRAVGLTSNPTDVELEAIAQTWSEHCKHKIFNALIEYIDEESGRRETIDGLFKTYIKGPSEKIGREVNWVVSSFEDNAGVVQFNERLNVVEKIETHNAPSAIDPYGGAITGIVGVNRDPMGTGKGAKPTLNVFCYCFGDPRTLQELPEGVLHPRIVRDGVHKGVIDGGNQSGVPLARGREFFENTYTFRPLVFCGTVGLMPKKICGEPSHVKHVGPGDLIVLVGGRTGKDGIHGATFSSAELDKDSPVQAVQIGDPITQKMMSDFLLEARDRGLYKWITDNGAGGLSSSVGETALHCNGCELDLACVPLKYLGLQPWEILVSEAQERMTVAVDPLRIDDFLELARQMDVEATVLGKFTDTGKFHIRYGEKTVGYLDLCFLHNGVPRMSLKATWKKHILDEPMFKEPENLNKVLLDMLSRLNVCSKEFKLRQYDHEVKGLSVVKPLIGENNDTPCDATISLLEYGSKEGLILAEGINPMYSEIDTYHMAASTFDEAVRRIIAAGGSLPNSEVPFYGLDNFCWNISSLHDEDGQFKLAQLVRANKALADCCLAFGIPIISGKDSMKNVWKIREAGGAIEKTVSIPPTLMFSARAKISDVDKAVTMDVKQPGDLVYVVGKTFDETGGSEYYRYVGETMYGKPYVGNKVPKVNLYRAKQVYERMSEATSRRLVNSAHTPTIGGLGVAFALTSLAGGYGISLDLRRIPRSSVNRSDVLLFSESNSRFIVSVPEEKKAEFEQVMEGVEYANVGKVTRARFLRIRNLRGELAINLSIPRLKEAWKKTLRGT